MTTTNDQDDDHASPIPIPIAPPSPAESDLDSLSCGSSSGSPSSPPAFHALSLSTSPSPTSPSLTRKGSNLSSWSDDEVTQRGMAVSAPVMPLRLPRGRGEGRRRSLTGGLRIEGEEERGRVALELARWINASPSPFETDSPRSTPLSTPIPRPNFPLFRPSGISQSFSTCNTSPQTVSDALGLDTRGLPVERKEESKGKMSTCGFIPFVPIPSTLSEEDGAEGDLRRGKDAQEVEGT